MTPALQYALLLFVYSAAQLILMTSAAYLAMKSTLPNGIWSITHYFAQRWPPLALRWLICLCMFFLVWGNPSVLDLTHFLHTFMERVGAAGLLGLASDSFWDKLLSIIFPGLTINTKLPPADLGP